MTFTDIEQQQIIDTFLLNLVDAEALWTGRAEQLAQRIIDAGPDILGYMFDDYFADIKKSFCPRKIELFHPPSRVPDHNTYEVYDALEVNGKFKRLTGNNYNSLRGFSLCEEDYDEWPWIPGEDIDVIFIGDLYNICPHSGKVFYAGRHYDVNDIEVETVQYNEDYTKHIYDLYGYKLPQISEVKKASSELKELLDEKMSYADFDEDYNYYEVCAQDPERWNVIVDGDRIVHIED